MRLLIFLSAWIGCRRVMPWVLVVGWALDCGHPSPEVAAPPEPLADRESWGERLEVIEPGLRVYITTSYLQYHGSSARTDSGVSVLFRDDSGDTLSTLHASRLTMDPEEKVGLGGNVTMSPGDSLVIAADSLIWERSGQRLRLLGGVLINARSGHEQGESLETDLEFRRWSMSQVEGRWHGSKHGEDYLVEVRADSSISERRGGQVIVDYTRATVAFDGAVASGPVARYDGVERTLRFRGGVSSADSIEQLTADELQFDLGGRTVQANGSVRLTREDWRLEASQVKKAGAGEPLRAAGRPAMLFHGARYLEAIELAYHADQRVFEATGEVLFRKEDTELRARNMIYFEARQTIEAVGAVAMQTPEVKGRFQGQSLSMDLEKGIVRFGGEPRLIREGDDSLTIESKGMTIDLERETLLAEGDFLLAWSGVLLVGERGEISGRGEKDERLMVSGAVVLTQRDGVVNGDSMVVQLSGSGRLGDVEVLGMVEARTQTSRQQTTWIKGRGAILSLAGDRLDRITLAEEANALHNDIVKGEVSQISGRQMELTFAADEGLVRIDVTGDAEFASRLAPNKEAGKPSLNEVKGEQLTILLVDGEIDQVIIAKPRGSYFPGAKIDR